MISFHPSNIQDSFRERYFLRQFVLPKLRPSAWAHDIEMGSQTKSKNLDLAYRHACFWITLGNNMHLFLEW
jgi:hypothetical protein